MRKISLVFVAAMLLSVGNLFANDDLRKVEPEKTLSIQIAEMLGNNEFVLSEEYDLTAEVRFTINIEGEIVVMSVETENHKLENFVKGRLNYKKVELRNFKEGKIYTIPVRVQA